MNDRNRKSRNPSRRGITLMLAVVFSVVMVGLVACAIDLGLVVLVRTQLQVAADSSAMAAAAMTMPASKLRPISAPAICSRAS